MRKAWDTHFKHKTNTVFCMVSGIRSLQFYHQFMSRIYFSPCLMRSTAHSTEPGGQQHRCSLLFCLPIIHSNHIMSSYCVHGRDQAIVHSSETLLLLPVYVLNFTGACQTAQIGLNLESSHFSPLNVRVTVLATTHSRMHRFTLL